MSYSFVTLWIVTHQAPLSMGFPWQEYWSGLPFPSPLPNLGIEPRSPALRWVSCTKLDLLHCRQILYQLSHREAQGKLELLKFCARLEGT